MNRSRSVSSSMEVLDSDHARYITSMITQHTRSMATGTRSLPTDSTVPYFQQPDRGHVLKGVPSDIDLPVAALHGMQNVLIPPRHASSDIFPYLPSSGMEYNPRIVDQDKLSTFTSLDDYDTLFEVRHGRRAIDSIPISGERVPTTSPVVIPILTPSKGAIKNSMIETRPKHTPDSEYPLPSQKDPASVRKEN